MPKNRKTYILIALVAVATYLLIDFTPLRRTIRGYPTRATREAALENRLKIDSLERLVQLWAFQVGNIQRVMSGREAMDLDSIAALQSATGETDMYATMYAKQDSILRGIVEKETALDLSQADSHGTLLEGLDFFTPLKGMVTEPYNLAINHPYIDIAADENATVYSILDGTVVSQAGDKVKTGTPIAIVGNTGRLATGVQLHLELWHAGEAIDPAKYISF